MELLVESLGCARVGAEWRKARTPHVCACGGTIHKGTRYFRTVWLVEGAVETMKEGDHIHTFEREAAAQAAYENQF